MFDYLKTIYRSMKYAGYYGTSPEPTKHSHLHDDMTMLMGIRS